MKWYWPGDWAVAVLLVFAIAVISAGVWVTKVKAEAPSKTTIIVVPCPAAMRSL